MSNYIANSKNRKFKKQILLFFERINFGAGKLPFSWRIILFMDGVLAVSLFFPWFQFQYKNSQTDLFFAFSEYTGYIGYGILIAIFAIAFFLVSHAKKEHIRAHIPFRLSDTQAVVFMASMLLTGVFHLLFISKTFSQFTTDVSIGKWFLIATSSIICIIVSAYFLSKNSKEQGIEMRYLDHQEHDVLWDYRAILDANNHSRNKEEDSNMTLPI